MNSLNSFLVKVETITSDEIMVVGHREFSNCCLIKIFVDGKDVGKLFLPDDQPLIVFEELERSIHSGGRYLIFTHTNGVADVGGWDGVSVVHDNFIVVWRFEYELEYSCFSFSFDKQEYSDEIKRAKSEIERSDYTLIPEAVLYPEHWGLDPLEDEQFEPFESYHWAWQSIRKLSNFLKGT